jgi:hypothetical protein
MKLLISDEDRDVFVRDDPETKEKVWTMLMEWFKEHEGFSGEMIGQNDDCQIYASCCLGQIADTVFVEKWK